jgi:rifampin ADP-ribosylating transferase
MQQPHYYHGARASYQPGDVVAQGEVLSSLDKAIWAAETGSGDDLPRVYEVDPASSTVIREVTEWTYYHGTRADLHTGDVIKPGHSANYGAQERTANYVYFSRTLDAATWGAELARGEGRERIYIVEPAGPFEDDPNVTDKKFRGNPTKSFRSREPLRVLGEVAEWQGHAPEVLQAMKDHIQRLTEQGIEPMDS